MISIIILIMEEYYKEQFKDKFLGIMTLLIQEFKDNKKLEDFSLKKDFST